MPDVLIAGMRVVADAGISPGEAFLIPNWRPQDEDEAQTWLRGFGRIHNDADKLTQAAMKVVQGQLVDAFPGTRVIVLPPDATLGTVRQDDQ
jgi:hypothetical protein